MFHREESFIYYITTQTWELLWIKLLLSTESAEAYIITCTSSPPRVRAETEEQFVIKAISAVCLWISWNVMESWSPAKKKNTPPPQKKTPVKFVVDWD